MISLPPTAHLTAIRRRTATQCRSRRLATAALAALMVAGLVACTSGEGGAGSTATGETADGSTGPSPTLSGELGPATAWLITGGEQEKTWAGSLDTWNAAHAEATITYEGLANDQYKQRIAAAVAEGSEPTLIMGWGSGGVLRGYVDDGVVLDLGGRVDALTARVLPSVVDAGRVDGKLYAVPASESQPVGFFYNLPVLQDAGVSVPITTFEGLLKAVAQIADTGVTPIALAGATPWAELMWFEYLVDRVGGTAPFAAIARGDEEAWSDPAITRALELLRQLIDAGAFGEDWASATADDSDDVALFYSGGAGLLLQGSWIYGTIKEQAQDFIDAGSLDTGVFPTVSGGTGDPAAVVGNPAQYWSVAAKADAAAQDTAIGYLDTEVLTESYVDTMISHGGIPPVAGVEAKLAASPDASYLTKAYALVRDAPSFQQSWDQALDPAVADALLAAVAGFFDGSLTADEFITTMNGTL